MKPISPAVIAALVCGCGGPGPVQVSRSVVGAYEASLTPSGDGFAIAWYDTRDGRPEIYSRLVDDRGRPQGPEYRLTNGPDASYEADIAAVEDNLAVAWYEKTSTGDLRANLGLWSREGQSRWARTISAGTRNGRNPVVRTRGQELFSAWIEGTGSEGAEVWSGWWDLRGRPLASPQRLGPAGRTTWNLNAALDSQGRAWVVFDARSGTRSEELFLAHVDKASSRVARVTTDDGFASKYPDLALGGDRAALTWFDERDGNKEVYLSIVPLREPSVAIHTNFELKAQRITTSPGESIGAYVAWNGKRFGLSWCDDKDNDGQHEVYFQSFDPAGGQSQPSLRLTRDHMSSFVPAIRPAGSGFALAWNEYPATAGRPEHDSNGPSEIMFSLVR